MFRYLPAIVLFGFILEISSIILVGRAVGIFPAVVLLLGGVAAGVGFIRMAGTNAVAALRSSIKAPGIHRNLASSTALTLLAGFLLVIPGFFSDLVAIFLLLPPVRSHLSERFRSSSILERARYGQQRNGWPPGPVIEVEVVEIEEKNVRTRVDRAPGQGP